MRGGSTVCKTDDEIGIFLNCRNNRCIGFKNLLQKYYFFFILANKNVKNRIESAIFLHLVCEI